MFRTQESQTTQFETILIDQNVVNGWGAKFSAAQLGLPPQRVRYTYKQTNTNRHTTTLSVFPVKLSNPCCFLFSLFQLVPFKHKLCFKANRHYMDLASFKKSQKISGVVRGLGEGGNLRAFFNTLPRDCCMNTRPHRPGRDWLSHYTHSS